MDKIGELIQRIVSIFTDFDLSDKKMFFIVVGVLTVLGLVTLTK